MRVRFNSWKGSSGGEWLYGGAGGIPNFFPALPSTGSKGNSYVMWIAAGTEDPLDTSSELYSRARPRSYITPYRTLCHGGSGRARNPSSLQG